MAFHLPSTIFHLPSGASAGETAPGRCQHPARRHVAGEHRDQRRGRARRRERERIQRRHADEHAADQPAGDVDARARRSARRSRRAARPRRAPGAARAVIGAEREPDRRARGGVASPSPQTTPNRPIARAAARRARSRRSAPRWCAAGAARCSTISSIVRTSPTATRGSIRRTAARTSGTSVGGSRSVRTTKISGRKPKSSART